MPRSCGAQFPCAFDLLNARTSGDDSRCVVSVRWSISDRVVGAGMIAEWAALEEHTSPDLFVRCLRASSRRDEWSNRMARFASLVR